MTYATKDGKEYYGFWASSIDGPHRGYYELAEKKWCKGQRFGVKCGGQLRKGYVPIGLEGKPQFQNIDDKYVCPYCFTIYKENEV